MQEIVFVTLVPDWSEHSPAEVRRYLAEIGVPLFAWSVDGPKPDSPWAEVQDISGRASFTRRSCGAK